MAVSDLSSTKWSRPLLLTLIASAGVLLSYIGFAAIRYKERSAFQAAMDSDMTLLGQAIERRLRFDFTGIWSVSRFVVRSQPGSREEFRRVANGAIEMRTDICAVYWIPPISSGDPDVAKSLSAMDSHGIVRELTTDGRLVPLAPLPNRDLFPIAYAETRLEDRSELGLDLMSVPEVKPLVEQAAKSGTPIMSRTIRWPPGSGQNLVFLVFRGVFEEVPETPGDPAASPGLIGISCLAIRADLMFDGAVEPLVGGIDTHLFDDANSDERKLICSFDSEHEAVRLVRLPAVETAIVSSLPPMQLDLLDGSWSAEFQPTAAYLAKESRTLALVSLCFGVLLTAVLTTYANTLLDRAERVQRLVTQRTSELQRANEKLEQEVQERRRTEESLARETFLLTTLLEYSPDFIYFKDSESRFLRIGRALAAYFGLADPSEAIGKTDGDFFDAEQTEQYRADEREVMERGEPVLSKEEMQPRQDGHTTWLSTSKVPLRNDAGKIEGTFGISRDITELKRVAEQLLAAKEAAEAANHAKSEFLANMSHEIRTPLNAVVGMTELVLDTQLTDSQRQYLSMARESGETLRSLVNDILDFSKIEAGRLEFERKEFDVHECLCDAVKSLAYRADQSSIKLACDIHPQVPQRVLGDETRLRQVLLNLVGNAVKFTEQGEVVVRLRCSQRTAERVTLSFSVSDTGIGIPADKLESIFETFEQADTSLTRKYGGTGLGLTISTRLVERMGGRITVQSVEGKGSTFTFTACFEIAGPAESALNCANGEESAPAESAASSEPQEPLRILLVEDSPINQKLAVRLLEKRGHEVLIANDGREAVAAWESQQPDLILMDVQMPEMDGYEATALIREREAAIHSHTPIVAMTAHAMKGDRERCLDAGMDGYVAKPIYSEQMHAAIRHAMNCSESASE